MRCAERILDISQVPGDANQKRVSGFLIAAWWCYELLNRLDNDVGFVPVLLGDLIECMEEDESR